jgi:mannose-6-phosphate isomerase
VTPAPRPGASGGLYPLLLEPLYKEKVWGGRRFERMGRSLPGDGHVLWGESWEVADLATTATSGGGGDPARSVIANGPIAGSTLTDLMATRGAEVLGDAARSDDGGFPLLVKYLDARRNLSVQVHPSPAYAARHPGARLKSEAWYVVQADPGAAIYKGLSPGITRAHVERAIRDGTVPDLLTAVPAVPGAAHYLPSGTCHALGAGVLVAEVQTPSDTTFRVYDWDRADRETHVEEALASMTFGPLDASAHEPDSRDESEGRVTRGLVRCPHFAIDEWSVPRGGRRDASLGRAEVWMVIEGGVIMEPVTVPFEPVLVPAGRTVLLPAAVDTVVAETTDDTRLLRITPGGA